MESIDILGCRVDAIDRVSAMEKIVELANGPAGSIVVTLGVEMVMAAQRDRRFRSVIAHAALNICDTIGLLLASRVRGGPLRHRVMGVDLVADLAARSAARGDVRLYFLGAAGDTAQRAADELRRRFPGAIVTGARNGYFRDEESAAIAQEIARSGANVVCVGLGSPKQEFWLSQFGAATGCGVGIGVGGSFDIFAGTVERAPRLLQRAGLEWAYRLVREPQRWRRQLALPRFAVAVLCERVASKERAGSKL